MRKIYYLTIAILLACAPIVYVSCESSPSDEPAKPVTPTTPTDPDDKEEPSTPSTISLTGELKKLSENTALKMWTCAHRCNTFKGIRDGVPENSIKAIEYAIEMGANMIEIDPRATSDGIIVNMHDATINRTTTGTGNVSKMTYQNLYQYNLKGSKGETGYKVPTLEEVLDAAKNKIFICVDVKEKEILDRIVKAVADKGMIDQVCYYTGGATSYVEQINEVNTGAIPFPWVSTAAEVRNFARYYKKVQMVQFSITNTSLSELMEAIKSAKLIGYANHLDWDSDLLNNKYSNLDSFIDNKIEVVQTDYPELVDAYLKEKGLK